MGGDVTVVLGIPVPAASPTFLALVGFHVLLGLCATIAGVLAMLSRKGPGRHTRFGTIYFWCLSGVFVSASVLAALRWAEDYHLFILGVLSFAAALFGRTALRRHWPNRLRLHLSGMGSSYILLLTAFYVDNGKSLPLWKELPSIAYWLLPSVIGVPLIARAVLRHPLVRQSTARPRAIDT